MKYACENTWRKKRTPFRRRVTVSVENTIFSSQEAAAMVLVACLVLGVGLGSVISYGTVSLLWDGAADDDYQNEERDIQDIKCSTLSERKREGLSTIVHGLIRCVRLIGTAFVALCFIFTCGYAGIVIVSFRCNKTLFSVYTRPMSNRNHVITRNEGHRFQIWGQKWPSRPFSRPKGQNWPQIQLRENNQNSVVLTKFQNLVVLTKF